MPDHSPDLIAGQYEVLERLRETSFGPVYRVRHTSLESILIFKELAAVLSSDPEIFARFKHNARLMARLRHESISRVLDIISDASRHFVVEEFVPASSLRTLLDARGPLRLEQALTVARQAAAALVHAHASGTIHGNLSPRSILVDDALARPAVLTDFGMAAILTPASDGDGQLLPYVPPELIDGAASDPDARVDVYSLGAVLFEMCEGRPMSATGRFTRPASRRLVDAIAKATAPDPADRHQTMAELVEDLDRCLAAAKRVASDITIVLTPPAKDIPRREGGAEAAIDLEPVAEPEHREPAAVEKTPVLDEPAIPDDAPVHDEPLLMEDFPSSLSTAREPAGSRRMILSVAAVATLVAAVLLYTALPGGKSPSAPVSTPQPRPLIWQELVPFGAEATIAGGATMSFVAKVAGAEGYPDVQYVWLVDGQEYGRGPTLEYRAVEDEDARAREVKVRASAGQQTVERTWHITVTPVTKPIEPPERVVAAPRVEVIAPPANRPPTITRATPRPDAPLTVVAGGGIDFAVRADDPDPGDELKYQWRLDGRPAGSAPRWRFTAPVVSDVERHSVEVRVTDARGEGAAPTVWSVEVRPAVTLARSRPATERVAIPAGQRAEFAVTASGTTDARGLTYAWSVDDHPVARSSDGRFQLPPGVSGGSHRVSVVAVDAAGARSKPEGWLLDVLGTPSAADRITEVEVRDWLTRFRDAWQSKDVSTLRTLGVVTSSEQETALRQVLSRHHGLRVTIRNETISLAGPRATVSFDRVDSDSSGAVIPQARQVYRLEKAPSGLVVAVAPGRARE